MINELLTSIIVNIWAD